MSSENLFQVLNFCPLTWILDRNKHRYQSTHSTHTIFLLSGYLLLSKIPTYPTYIPSTYTHVSSYLGISYTETHKHAFSLSNSRSLIDIPLESCLSFDINCCFGMSRTFENVLFGIPGVSLHSMCVWRGGEVGVAEGGIGLLETLYSPRGGWFLGQMGGRRFLCRPQMK